jgi:hypothetical protein
MKSKIKLKVLVPEYQYVLPTPAMVLFCPVLTLEKLGRFAHSDGWTD